MASTALRPPIGHDDRLSLVDHLDELRSRLIISVVVITAAFVVCFWQNGQLLDVVNRPLERETQKSVQRGEGPAGADEQVRRAVSGVGSSLDGIARSLRDDANLEPATRAALGAELTRLRAELDRLPDGTEGRKPLTLGVGEPFSNTLVVSGYFAILLAMPFVLWQAYAFVLPAFSPAERRVALPLMSMIPVLFLLGVAFGYFLVLPAAVKFLQSFNADEFDIAVQAKDYYRFAALTLGAMGLVFQVPVGILALTKFRVLSVEKLRRNRRYALVASAALAAPLPGVDPITMMIEAAMIYVLYEAGILLASVFVGRSRDAPADEPDDLAASH